MGVTIGLAAGALVVGAAIGAVGMDHLQFEGSNCTAQETYLQDHYSPTQEALKRKVQELKHFRTHVQLSYLTDSFPCHSTVMRVVGKKRSASESTTNLY
jgi:hypothetical protein